MSQTTYPLHRTVATPVTSPRTTSTAITPNNSASVRVTDSNQAQPAQAQPAQGAESFEQQRRALHDLVNAEVDRQTGDVSDLIDKLCASGLKVEREDVGQPAELSSEERSTVYKIVQESLVNVLLHGSRTEKTVVLFEWSSTELALTVASALRADPISYGAGEAYEGDGLPMMREAVRLLGGEFNAHAGYGRWVVSVDFAISPSESSSGLRPLESRQIATTSRA